MFLLDGWLKHQPVNDPTGILFGSETVTWLVVDCHPRTFAGIEGEYDVKDGICGLLST